MRRNCLILFLPKKGVQKKKVNISGLDYDVIFANLKDTLGLDDTAGWCGKSIPVILIDNKNKPFWITDNQVIRHELMHAFFFRNGMKDYSADEKLVDWLANELPNIQKACQQLDCVE